MLEKATVASVTELDRKKKQLFGKKLAHEERKLKNL